MDDWIKNMIEESERIRAEQKVDEKLTENLEYQEKLKTIDIQIWLVNKKLKELYFEKEKLRVEYGNKELENMGSKFRIKPKGPINPFG